MFRYTAVGPRILKAKISCEGSLVFDLNQLVIRKIHCQLHAISQNNSLRKLESIRFNS